MGLANATTRRSFSRSVNTCRGVASFATSPTTPAGLDTSRRATAAVSCRRAGCVGVTTCWEVIFDRAAREAVLNGAQMLAVPSNNATFNEQMSSQQLAFAKMRAIEHGRSVVVAGTTGISAVITPAGRVVAKTDFFEPAYLVERIPLQIRVTPATRWAPYVQWVLIAIAVSALAIGLMTRSLNPSSAAGGSTGSRSQGVNGWAWRPTRRS